MGTGIKAKREANRETEGSRNGAGDGTAPNVSADVQGGAPVPMTLGVPLPAETVYSRPDFRMAGLQLDKPTESGFLTIAPFSQCSRALELQATTC